MRFLLLFLSLFLQFNVVNANIPQITAEQTLSIVTNYMGTPEAMYREDGEAVWKCELNSYGKVRKFQGKYVSDCPFRYQGQYEDAETGLYYNRFRYYDPDTGNYISQDPIGLNGGINLYAYVHDPNGWLDILGLAVANQGRGYDTGAKTHGGDTHNASIVDRLKTIRENPIVKTESIRVNQRQVDVNGKEVGKNRPDIQYDTTNGIHHNVEFDTNPDSSANHKHTIEQNDPNAKNEYLDEKGVKLCQ